MAVVTEASLRERAMEVLAEALEGDLPQKQIDTALDVLGILRDGDDEMLAAMDEICKFIRQPVPDAIAVSADDMAAIMASGDAPGPAMLSADLVEWAASVDYIEGEPWMVSVTRLVNEKEAEDAADAEVESESRRSSSGSVKTDFSVRMSDYDAQGERAPDAEPVAKYNRPPEDTRPIAGRDPRGLEWAQNTDDD